MTNKDGVLTVVTGLVAAHVNSTGWKRDRERERKGGKKQFREENRRDDLYFFANTMRCVTIIACASAVLVPHKIVDIFASRQIDDCSVGSTIGNHVTY